MATTPTNKPVGSNDVKDLLFNSEKIDEVVNSDSLTYVDRLDNQRLTIKGLEEAAVSAGPTVDAAIEARNQANEAKKNSDEIIAKTEEYIESAKTSALNAEVSAINSEASAARAESASESIVTDAKIFGSVANGLANTAAEEYFRVWQNPATGKSFIYYWNDYGVARELTNTISQTGVINYIAPSRISNMNPDGGLSQGFPIRMKGSSSTTTVTSTVYPVTDAYLLSIGCVNSIKKDNSDNYSSAVLAVVPIPPGMVGKYVTMSAIIISETGSFGADTAGSYLGDASLANITSGVTYSTEFKVIDATKRVYKTTVKIPAGAVNLHIGKGSITGIDRNTIALTSIFYAYSDVPLALDNIKWDAPSTPSNNLFDMVDSHLFRAENNIITFGGMDGGNNNPYIRNSASTVVELANQEMLKQRGYTHAIKWRAGNEFIGVDRAAVVGDYVGGYFLVYSEPSDKDRLLSAQIFTLTSGTFTHATVIDGGWKDLGGNLRLVWGYYKIPSAVDSVWIGSSVAPSSERYATGFSLYSSNTPFDMGVVIRNLGAINTAKVLIDKYKQQSTAPVGSSVKLSGVDGESFIKCQSESEIERRFMLRKSPSLTASTPFNFIRDTIDGVVLRDMNDDVAPVRAFGTTIGGNHGYYMSLVTTTAPHGKTAADVGAVYANGGVEFVIVGIVSATQLYLTFKSVNTTTVPTGSYTRVSGGSNTASFTTSAITGSVNWYSPLINHVTRCFVDGREVQLTGEYTYTDTFSVAETYDIISKDSMISQLTGGAAASELRIQLRYVFDTEGQCTIHSSFLALKSGVALQDIMFAQAVRCAANDGEVRYYIPKTLPFTLFGKDFDYSKIESSSTSGWTDRINMTPSRCVPTGILADRAIQLTDNYAFSMGYLPIDSAGVDFRRGLATVKAMQLSQNGGKIYLSCVDKGAHSVQAGDYYSAVVYRNISKRSSGRTCSYIVKNGADYYLYADWHSAVVDSIPIPAYLTGKSFVVVEASSGVNVLSKSLVNGIDVSVPSGNNYLILKIS